MKNKFFLEWVENIAGKGENAGYQHFLLFPQCFQKPPFKRSLKVRLVLYSNKFLSIHPSIHVMNSKLNTAG